jgi:hypothetical protein
MKKICLLGVLICSAVIALPCNAAPATMGPYKDFKGTVTTTASVTVNTSLSATINIPFDGTLTGSITDFASVSVSVTTPVYVPTYVTVQTSAATPFDKNTDSVLLTDIYAMDLNPGNETPLVLTGFNPFAPEVQMLTPETFVGVSGTNYPASLLTSTLGNLPALLPGFDLSAFVGDPNSIVYVNQATMPATDVPEPAGCMLFAVGAIAFGIARLGMTKNRTARA